METRRRAILCLCYDTNILQVRQMLLEHFGYKVLPTASVEDARSVAEHQCPDMLLMDNNDFAIDLFERVAKQVKEICPEVITVVLSHYHYAGRNGSDGAVDHFLPKDGAPDDLVSQIGELFEQQTGRGDTMASAM